ncbi:hypothetical protein ABIA35_006774 [Catenulispora sp. MAP12-49]
MNADSSGIRTPLICLLTELVQGRVRVRRAVGLGSAAILADSTALEI